MTATGAPDTPDGPDTRQAPDAATVSVSINGEVRRIPGGLTLDRLVATLSRATGGVAAAVNETVVPRDRWAGTALGDGDRVEVLTAVQGG
ncbi:sulfur carrier protein ThiS [Streptomyces sp. YGL11-2]|uniref:sulfur carrier protein ThiS n=1 Tax=Streptomyces sp. YGL11-2 TaxID=3414028 RepID=UPI003CEF4500